MDMKGFLNSILTSAAILLAISSCIMVGKGELRLLNIEVPESGRLRPNVQYWVRINFEAEGNPEIPKACFYWSGDGPYCVDVKDVKYGSFAHFQVPLYARVSSDSLQCYVEYVREGKIQRSNVVASRITGTM